MDEHTEPPRKSRPRLVTLADRIDNALDWLPWWQDGGIGRSYLGCRLQIVAKAFDRWGGS